MALDSRSNSMLPCPWYKEDLSWIPTALGQRDEVEIEIWETPRQGCDIATSASSGCELCARLCAITQEFDSLGEPAELELESWLHLDCISLEPTRLRFLVQSSGIEHCWLHMHIEVQGGQNCKIQ